MSCFHSECERSVGKVGLFVGISAELILEFGGFVVVGYMASRCNFVVSSRPGSEDRAS